MSNYVDVKTTFLCELKERGSPEFFILILEWNLCSTELLWKNNSKQLITTF